LKAEGRGAQGDDRVPGTWRAGRWRRLRNRPTRRSVPAIRSGNVPPIRVSGTR